MREILFRGKRKCNGKWVDGFYHCVADTYTQKNHHYITTFKKLDNGEIILTGQFEVFPDTVGQYTGLTDKNGTKIFKGDIVQNATTKETAVVRWYEEHSAFMIFDKNNSEIYFLYDNNFNNIVVIGNIHDNPELLEANL